MQKPKRVSLRVEETGPILACFFEQAECPVHVRPDKIVRAVNRAVHVAFGREVNNRSRPVRDQQFRNQITVAYVALQKFVPPVGRRRQKIGRIASVGELVEINYIGSLVCEPVQDKVGADETSPAGHQNCVGTFFQPPAPEDSLSRTFVQFSLRNAHYQAFSGICASVSSATTELGAMSLSAKI